MCREYSVDVGVVEIVETNAGERQKNSSEIDFVVNKGSKKILYSICAECFGRVKARNGAQTIEEYKGFFQKDYCQQNIYEALDGR